MDLPGRRFQAHVGDLDPEHGEDGAADQHNEQVDTDPTQDLPDRLGGPFEPLHPVATRLDRGGEVEQATHRLADRRRKTNLLIFKRSVTVASCP
jgi:hypothetical protein